MDENSTLTSTADSTDMLLRELNALQLDRSAGSTVGSNTGMLNSGDMGSGLPGSGDGSHHPTVSQLMKTLASGNHRQEVLLHGDDSFHAVYGATVEVNIATSSLATNTGSNKVKTSPIVNFDWASQYYYGNMVAAHPHDNNVIAFTLKGKSGGNIRIIHRKTGMRCLLKGFTGSLVDISFAHSEDYYIAGIDDLGYTLVFKLTLDKNTIHETLVLEIHPRADSRNQAPQEICRVIWCPYIPEENDDEEAFDAKYVLAVINGRKVEVWAVDRVAKERGQGPVSGDDTTKYFVDIEEHKQEVVDGAFSPDGTALAIASLSGEVTFYQIYFNDEGSPKCLHNWKPHDGKPLSCLFFLDNHKSRDPPESQFWRYAITGCNRNQELKIWSCVNWNCFQTLNFQPAPGVDGQLVSGCLKAALDMTAQYLLLCSCKSKMLYILQVYQDKKVSHFSSISEFHMAKPCLSLAVLEATNRRSTSSPSELHMDEITTGELDHDEDDDTDEEDGDGDPRKSKIQIKLVGVQHRSLNQMVIRYEVQSSVAHPTMSVSSLSTDPDLRDGLTDVSMSGAGDSGPDASFSMAEGSLGPDGDRLTSVTSSQAVEESSVDREDSPALLTPDDFRRKALPGVLLPNGGGAASAVRGSGSSTSSFTAVTALPDESYMSPRSSGDPSVLSPASSKVVSEHLVSPAARGVPKGLDTTPTSLPLPPVTLQEEEDLVSSRSSGASSQQSGQQGSPATQPQPGSFFYSKSPGQVESSGDTAVEESRPTPRRSTRSSDGHDTYDEEDAEVAQVLEGTGRSSSGKLSGTGLFQHGEEEEEEDAERVEIEEEIEVEEEVVAEEEEEDEDEEEEETESSAWPKPPTVDPKDHFKGAKPRISQDESEEGNEFNDDDNNDELDEETEEVDSRPSPKVIVREIVDREALSQVSEMVGSLHSAVTQQGEVLAALQRQLQQQQQHAELVAQQLQELQQSREQMLQAQLAQATPAQGDGDAQASLLPRIEAMLGARMQGETQRVQNELAKMKAASHQDMDRMQNFIGQTITARVNTAVCSTVRSEMKNLLTPAVNDCLAPLRERLTQETQRSIQANENVMRDAIGKMVRNRSTAEAIGSAVTSAVPGPLQTAFAELFRSQVIPAFQHASANMFQQVQDCFLQGTTDYKKTIESYLERMRQRHEQYQDPTVVQLQKSVEALQSSVKTLPLTLSQQVASAMSQQLQAFSTQMQGEVVTRMKTAVKEEMALHAREQEASLRGQLASIARSAASTPVPSSTVDPTTTLARLHAMVQQDRLVEAFQVALNAANLEVVVGLCEMVKPDKVFSGRQPFPLAIVLSLIHQLCSRLTLKTDVKLQFLEEAILMLKNNKAILKEETVPQEHIRSTLSHVIKQLRAFVTSPSGESSHLRSARMLITIAESIAF